MPREREYCFDHLRALLVLLVVFGHYLELTGAAALYRAIYVFHIPALLFLSGRYARFSVRRLLRLLLTYAVFQTLYRLFDWLVTGRPQTPAQWIFVPYWHLWYLVALAAMLALTPCMEKLPERFRIPMLLASVCVALFWGFLPFSGYYFSFGRILSFFPFYLAGLYLKSRRPPYGKRRAVFLPVLAAAAITGTLLLVRSPLPTALLYGSMNFARSGGTLPQKLAALTLGFLWVALLFTLPWPTRPIPVWSVYGRRTLSIYLLHGFLVRLVEHFGFSPRSAAGALAFALATTALLGLVPEQIFHGRSFFRKMKNFD